MVSIFTGAGTGFERGSGNVLGGAGLLGAGAMGRAGEQVMLNAATGNLLISRQDEYLVGRGPDAAVARTYNSLGDLSDDNGDNWRQSTQRQVRDLTGTANTWGSTVKRVSGDGSVVTYAYDGAGYVTTDGAGAHDRMTYDGTWRWTDSDSRAVEVYGGPNNQLSQLTDTSGNTLTYSYAGDKLSDITTANGERIHYGWAGNNLAEINTVYHDGSNWRQLTRVRYDYDGYNRLASVTVDLSPEDNSTSDGNRYLTSYTYHGASKLVASITQTDGSRLDIGYDGYSRVNSLTQTIADGVGRTTSIGYGAGYTNVTDPHGQTTRLDCATDDFAVDVDTWGRAATLTRDSATIDGRRATRLTIQTGGEWAGNYQGFAVAAGETLTFGLTLQAQGSVTEHDLGLYSDQTGWGAAGISHARIVSGPGRIEQIAGGIWRVVGLSTTTGTRVEITRTYDQSGSGGAYFYVDNPGGYRAGVSLLAADASLTRSADAGSLGAMSLENWGYGGVSRTHVGTIDGGTAYRYTAQTTGDWAGIATGLTARKGDQFAFALSLQAVGDITTQALGLYGDSSGWGDPSWATARILSGPGTITNAGGGTFRVSGLSMGQPTRIQIIRTFDRDETGGAYFYVDNPGGYRAGASLIAGAPMLTRLSPRPSATAGQLLSVTLPSAQNGAPQQVVRFTYDAAGNLASTSNAAGSTRFGYDERGNVVRVEDPNGNVTTRLYDARNLLLAETVTGSDQNGPAAAHTTRFAYDGAGRLRYAVDAEGGVTEYAYDGFGQSSATGRFANVRYDTTGWPATQALDLGSIDHWKAQVDKSSVHVTHTPLDGRGNVVQEIVYGSTGADGSWQTHNGYTHRYFTRDQAGQVLSRVDAGRNAETFVYDGLGRVVASTDTGGATTRIAFQDASQRTVVTLASGMVTTSTFNRAGELVAEASGGHYHQGGTASYAYDSLGRLRIETDATGLSTAYVYDRLNRKVAELNRDGWMTEYRYDAADRLVATVRYTHVMAGWQRDAAFDPNHSPQVADLRPPAHGQDIWLWNVYDAGGRLAETIGGDGSATIFEYDAADRLVRTTAYANKLEGWRIEAFKATTPAALQGPPASAADSVGRRFYDRAGRLVGTLDGEGRLSRTGWDAIGEKVDEVHYGNLVPDHLRGHGSFAQIVASVGSHSADAVTRWVYDGQGHLRYEIDALNRVTEHGYEYEGWKWSAFGPLRQTVRYAGSIATLGSYTIDTMRQAIANAGLAGHGGNRTSQAVYDGAGRMVYAIDAGGAVTGYRYDVLGNVVRKVEYADRRTVGGLPDEGGMNAWQDGVIGNPANRVTRSYYSASGQLRFTVDGEGYVTRNDYDAEGRLTFAVRWNNPVAANDGWSIDTVAGNLGGDWAGTTYGYNVDGRLSRVTDGNGVTKEYAYWANGTLAWEIAAAGMAEESRVHHVYDGAGREVTRYDATWSADQMATQYAYDGRGNLVTVTDAGGRVTTNGYDRAGQLVTVTDAMGGLTSYGYDALGNRVRETDARGAVTWSYHDKAGRIVAVRDAENYVTETSYTVFGEVASVTRRANQSYTGQGPDYPHVHGHGADATTHFSYDRLGRATISWDAEGYVEQRWYDAFGNAVQEQNKAGGVTRRVFDRRGLMIAEITPAGSIDAGGGTVAREAAITRFDPTYYARANGDLAGMAHDVPWLTWHWQNYGWRERRNPNAFFNTGYYLDNNPDVAAAGINPLDHYRDAGIREGRRPAGEAAGTTTVLVGSPAGRFDAAYYRAANTDLAGLDDNGLLHHWQNYGWRERRNPNAFFDTYYYLSVHTDVAAAGIDPLDHYRDAGIGEGRRPAQTIAEPAMTGGTVARFEYDARGNLVRKVEAAGLPEQRITSHAYDKADRLVETRGDAVHWVDQGGYNVQGKAQPIERRRYDGRGNLVELTDARGARTLFFYDKLGRKTEQVDAMANIVSWRYDAVGNLTHERRWALRTPHPDGAHHPGVTGEDRVTDYTYDRLNRMTSSIVRGVRTGNWNGSYYHTGVNDVATSYDYDASGNVLRVVDGAGNAVHTTYDRLGRRSRQVDAEGFITAWLYDAEGNVHHERRWAQRSPGYGVGWSHDPGVTGDDRVTDFTHDKMGRRLTETRRGVVAYAADGNGNLYGVSSDATVNYAYDGLGQVTRRAEATGEATIYEYDAAGRLAHETRAGYHDQDGVWTQPLVTYRYNALGDVTLTEQTRQGGGDVRVVRYGYTAGGRLHTMTDATGTVFTYWQDIAGAEVIQTWNRNRSDGSLQHEGVMYTRDALGRVQSQATGWHNGAWNKGDVQETRYNVFGEVAQRGINGLQEDFAYDKLGNLARTNSGDGVWRYFVSDGAGRRTITLENQKRDDLAGTSVDQALDVASNGSQTPMDQAYVDGVAATIAVYDRRGQQIATKLPNRELAAGQVQSLELAAGYNPFGELAWERDAAGATTSYGYNTMGRRTMVQRAAVVLTDEAGNGYWSNPTERSYYDAGGRLVGQDDANGRRTTRHLLAGTGYGSSEALVTAEFHADGGVKRFGYDRFGDLRRATDEIGRTTVMHYDAAGHLTQQIRPSGQWDQYGYDVLGQRLWHVNSHLGWDERETSDYDHQGRVTSTRAFGGEVTGTSYTWYGYLHTGGMGTFGGWQQTTNHANGFERVEQSDVFGRTIYSHDHMPYVTVYHTAIGYDRGGRMTSRSGNEGEAVSYSWYNTGLLSAQSSDLGSGYERAASRYNYDAAGRKTYESFARDGTQYTQSYASYDALGRMTYWHQAETALPWATMTWAFDAVGNIRRTTADKAGLDQHGNAAYRSNEDRWFRYDAMNRVTLDGGVLSGGQIVRGWNGASLTYDHAGQRIGSTRDAWLTGTVYVYDPYAGGGGGYPYHYYEDYDRGQWVYRDVSYQGLRQESFGYDADGQLTRVDIAETSYDDDGNGNAVSTGRLDRYGGRAEFQLDGMGRQTRQLDYNAAGQVAYDRQQFYSVAGRVDRDHSVRLEAGATLTADTWNDYGGNAALGQVVSATTYSYRNGQHQGTTSYSNAYNWRNGGAQIASTSTWGQTSSTTSYGYGAGGRLETISISDGRPRTISVTSDLSGQALMRDESDNNYNAGDPHERWYRFNGNELGHVGNDGTWASDYAGSIQTRGYVQQNGALGNNRRYGFGFSESIDGITSYEQGSSGGGYTVRAGDTLSGIAAQMWGDASLWYKLAQANGLSANGALTAGATLTIPAGVVRSTYNADQLRPYDPTDAIGDVSPVSTQPTGRAKKNKCGAFGKILLVAVAVAVAVVSSGALAAASISAVGGGSVGLGAGISAAFGGTVLAGAGATVAAGTAFSLSAGGLIAVGAAAGAIGSIASQGLGLATGIQDKFSWKGVALAGIAGGVGGALGTGNIIGGVGGKFATAAVNGAVRGAISNAAVQGIALATGLQGKFDWVGVAVGAAVGAAAGGSRIAASESVGGRLLSGMAGALAGGAARSVLEGTSFGDNVLAALPDVIGQTIGGYLADRVTTAAIRAEARGQYRGIMATGEGEAFLQLAGFDPSRPPSPADLLDSLSLTSGKPDAGSIDRIKGRIGGWLHGEFERAQALPNASYGSAALHVNTAIQLIYSALATEVPQFQWTYLGGVVAKQVRGEIERLATFAAGGQLAGELAPLAGVLAGIAGLAGKTTQQISEHMIGKLIGGQITVATDVGSYALAYRRYGAETVARIAPDQSIRDAFRVQAAADRVGGDRGANLGREAAFRIGVFEQLQLQPMWDDVILKTAAWGMQKIGMLNTDITTPIGVIATPSGLPNGPWDVNNRIGIADNGFSFMRDNVFRRGTGSVGEQTMRRYFDDVWRAGQPRWAPMPRSGT